MKNVFVILLLVIGMSVSAQSVIKDIGTVSTVDNISISVKSTSGGSIQLVTKSSTKYVPKDMVAKLIKVLQILESSMKDVSAGAFEISDSQYVSSVSDGEKYNSTVILFHYLLNKYDTKSLLLMYFKDSSEKYIFDSAGLATFIDLINKSSTSITSFIDQQKKFDSIVVRAKNEIASIAP